VKTLSNFENWNVTERTDRKFIKQVMTSHVFQVFIPVRKLSKHLFKSHDRSAHRIREDRIIPVVAVFLQKTVINRGQGTLSNTSSNIVEDVTERQTYQRESASYVVHHVHVFNHMYKRCGFRTAADSCEEPISVPLQPKSRMIPVDGVWIKIKQRICPNINWTLQ
jgi:hypothetical protein